MAFILAALLGPASGTTGTGPTPYTAAIQQARDALARQDASAGLVWVDRALRANPAGLDALILLGRTQMRLEQYDTAAAAFQRAADLSDPGSVENIQALFVKADALARQEKN
ncbi:MAG: hypothetical protein ACE5GT_13850, partial [Rhodospirillales bacterium]